MIIAYVFTGVLVLVSLLIQGHSSFDVISIHGIKPDLIFIVVVYVSYSFGSYYGEVTGFISGLLHDSISNGPLGILTFPKMALGFLVGMFGRAVIKNTLPAISLLVFIASIVKGVITLFLCYLFHQAFLGSLISIVLPESFYNALLAPLLFLAYDKIFGRDLERGGR